MKTVTLNQLRFKLILTILLSVFITSNTFATNANIIQVNSQLPSFLVGTYNGNLMNNNTIITDGSCTIKHNRNSSYTFSFSNGVSPIKNIKFSKDDDTYTSSFIYKGKTFAATVDEDGDLAINAASGYSTILSFSGEINLRSNNNTRVISNNTNQTINTNNDSVFIRNGNQTISTNKRDNDVKLRNGNQTIETDRNAVFIKNGNQTINTNHHDNDVELHNGNQTIKTTEHDDVFIKNGNQTISTNSNGTRINNGNVSISTNGNGVNINGSISIGQHEPSADVVVCSGWTNCRIANCHHDNAPVHYYDCGAYEIARLPQNAIGFYKGKLNGYRTDTRKGICKIVETGCKTYRLDFSNNLPSIHGVQFGRRNNFDEYTSVVIEGQYSAAIEIDMSFSDLSIDGEIMAIDFNGDKQ